MGSSHKSSLDTYWEQAGAVYDTIPTVRHRKRWVLSQLDVFLKTTRFKRTDLRVLDYGCGTGQLLRVVSGYFGLPLKGMHGFDPSRVAVETAERDFPGMNTHHTLSPLEEKTFNVIICSEVIEHTPDFRDILGWLYRHLEIDGLLLLTTQSGKIYQADRYAGHTQHFQRAAVSGYLEQAGFAVIQERSWGFPFYSLQKYVSDLRFDAVRTQFMESKRNWVTKFVFGGCYCLYFIHDLIAAGPQLYFTASKVTSSSTR